MADHNLTPRQAAAMAAHQAALGTRPLHPLMGVPAHAAREAS